MADPGGKAYSPALRFCSHLRQEKGVLCSQRKGGGLLLRAPRAGAGWQRSKHIPTENKPQAKGRGAKQPSEGNAAGASSAARYASALACRQEITSFMEMLIWKAIVNLV